MIHRSSHGGRAAATHIRNRVWFAVACAVPLALAAPSVANASPPDHQPAPNVTFDIHLAAGEAPCGPLTITLTDGERITTFSNGVVLVTGQLRAVVASDVTGRSVSLNISGPGKFFPDGSALGGGAWLLWDTDVLVYTVGRITLPPGGGLSGYTVRGRVVEVCPLLGL
jgi:hypothetical protein